MPKFLNPEFAGTQGIGIVLTKSSPQKQQRIVAISDDTSFRSFCAYRLGIISIHNVGHSPSEEGR
jgi:hypothetical protein